MHSTNDVFDKEKEKLFKIANDNNSNIEFVKIDNKESYYIDYLSSKHFDNPIIEYSSADIVELRNQLSSMWKGTSYERTIPIFIAGINKSKEETDNYLQQVDLHNYMM